MGDVAAPKVSMCVSSAYFVSDCLIRRLPSTS